MRRGRIFGEIEEKGEKVKGERRVKGSLKKMWRMYEDPTEEQIEEARKRVEAKRNAPSIPYVVPKPFLTEAVKSSTAAGFVRSLKRKLWSNNKMA